MPLNDCFAPLDAYAARVQEIQQELQPTLGPGILLKVVVSGDEQDPMWWEEIRKRGWLFVDHGEKGENTAANHGAWWVTISSRHHSVVADFKRNRQEHSCSGHRHTHAREGVHWDRPIDAVTPLPKACRRVARECYAYCKMGPSRSRRSLRECSYQHDSVYTNYL